MQIQIKPFNFDDITNTKPKQEEKCKEQTERVVDS